MMFGATSLLCQILFVFLYVYESDEKIDIFSELIFCSFYISYEKGSIVRKHVYLVEILEK